MDRSAAQRSSAPAATYDTRNQVDTVPTSDRYSEPEVAGGGTGSTRLMPPPPDRPDLDRPECGAQAW